MKKKTNEFLLFSIVEDVENSSLQFQIHQHRFHVEDEQQYDNEKTKNVTNR